MFHYRRSIQAIMLAGVLLSQTACHRDSENQAPTAVFAALQPSVEQVTTFTFSPSGSTDHDGTITSFAWDFGDGASSTASSPTHVYRSSGSYVVKLTVTDNNGATDSTMRTVIVQPQAVSASLGTAATTISLPEVVSVDVPEAAFSSPTHVGIWATANAITAADFDVTAQMFSSPLRAKHEIRVNSGKLKPSKILKVTASLPAELEARMQQNDEPQVFVQIFQDGGDEVLDSFELVPAEYNASGKTLQFDLDPDMFTDRRSSDETWEAVFLVGSTRTKPMPSAAPKPHPGTAGNASEAEVALPWPRLAIAGQFSLPAPHDRALLTATTCEGATLRPPLTDLTVTGAYKPPKHYGVDYRAADGTEVRSMADGTVFKIGFDERPLPRADPRSGKMVKGWGHYVVIAHSDGSKSLYAHLQTGDIKVSAGDMVAAGALIALSDNSGGSQAPHLHVEYAPNGEIFKKGSKTDPHSCIGNNINGNVQVRDNGSLADDAFSVSLNGKEICTTNIGASNNCSIGALRSGTAALSITANIAPDNVGTYEITLTGGLAFQDGGTVVFGTLSQGATATFVITIP